MVLSRKSICIQHCRPNMNRKEKATEVITCERCGNRLALGMAIVKVFTIAEEYNYKLCGACRTYLLKWLEPRHVFNNIVEALQAKFGNTESAVQPDVDLLNNSWLIYLGTVTVEVTFNEDTDSDG